MLRRLMLRRLTFLFGLYPLLWMLPAHAQTGGAFARPRPLPALPPLPPRRAANPPAATGSTRELLEPPDGRAYHGASLPDTWSEGGLRTQLAQYQKVAGRKLSVVTWFAACYGNGRLTSWRGDYLPVLRRVRAAGAISLIKFSPQDPAWAGNGRGADLRDITRGVYDAYWEDAADTCREFGAPLWISFCHEMNGTWYPYSQGFGPKAPSARDFIAAWRHVVGIFRAHSARNVAWVWAPNVPDVGPVAAAAYYPGDEWVDWVGASFYSGNPLANLDDFYRQWAPHKPIFITEWATGIEKNRYYVGFPGEANWVSQVFSALQARYPRIKGISWFQWDKSDGNYLLQRVPEQQKIYAREIASPRYIDSAPAPGTSVAPIETPAREVVLREADAPSVAPPAARGREVIKREPIKLQIVPRERVLRER